MLSNVHLRRLSWALESPSFLSLPLSVDYFQNTAHRKHIKELISSLDQDSALVDPFFEKLGKLPMGRYFEQLLLFILQKDPFYKVHWFNQQIINPQRITEGEIDLILEDAQGAVQHWEIALKFYLQVADRPEHDHYWGPSRRDYLAKKMTKLREQQLALGKHIQVKETFGEIPSRIFLKGQLFYPPYHTAKPLNFNPKATRYKAILEKNLEDLKDRASYFKVLYKPDWIGPFFTDKPQGLSDFEAAKAQLQKEFLNQFRPQMLILLAEENGFFCERERYFILPGNWPTEPAQ